MSTTFIGREQQLTIIQERIQKYHHSYVISIQGRGGVGKTYLLKKIQQECAGLPGCLCFPIVDFSQIRTRTVQWLMEQISEQAPTEFKNFKEAAQSFRSHGLIGGARAISQEDVEEAFLKDFCELESSKRCIFLFDTFEYVLDTLLCGFILDLARQSENCVFILAGRRNDELKPRLSALLNSNAYIMLELGSFDEKDAVEYIRSHPAGVNLTEEEQGALYLLSDNGLPIKLALALDWLSRGLLMQTMMDYPLDRLNTLSTGDLQGARLEFERELVTLVGKLGTHVDQVIYIMAHVNRRFNRELLDLLLPGVDVEDLIKKLQDLPFVKFIEPDFFVLHDELQRMVLKNVWQWSDQNHETRQEISEKVIQYYQDKINTQAPKGQAEATTYDQYILEIEMLYYELDVNLLEGYQRFTRIFDELEDSRNIELAALALDTLMRDRSLPVRLNAFVKTYYTGWINVRRQPNQQVYDEIEEGLKSLQALPSISGLSEKMAQFLEQEVDLRTVEIYTLLGYTSRLLGNWPTAITQYDEARKQQEKLIDTLQGSGLAVGNPALDRAISHLAEILNDIANLQRMEGNLETARLYCKTSLLIRQALKETRAQGHCYYVMSMIMWETGNTNEAMYSLHKARALYQEANQVNLERAWLDRYEAFIMYRTGNIPKAQDLLNRAIEITSTNPGLQDEHAEVLLFLSRISLDQDRDGDFSDALEKAHQALDLAQKVGNNYRITEAYLTLCRCLLARKNRKLDWQEGLYHKYLQTGQQLAQENHYHRLESIFAELLAGEAFEAHDYYSAFDQYTIACQKATEFKTAVFERTLSKLGEQLDRLLSMDPDRTLEVCGRILRRWCQNTKMAEANPCFVDEVNYIQRMAEGMIEQRRLDQSFHNENRKGNWKNAQKICDQLDALPVFEGVNQGRVWYQRAQVDHNANNFSYARMYCERAIRIQMVNHAPLQELGDSLLLLSQIYWKLGNTAEAAQYLDNARNQYQKINSKLGLLLVDLEQAYIYFRTYQYERSRALLETVSQSLQAADMNANVHLANALNLMARLTRSDPQSTQYYEYAFPEAERRGKRALEILQDQDWYISAEIHLTVCILYYSWYQALIKDGKSKEARQYLALAKKFNQEGWKKIQNIQSPNLASVFHGFQANIYAAEGAEEKARKSFFEELAYATQTKHMRLLRAVDLVEDWLVKQPEESMKAHAGWIVDEWGRRGMDQRYPLVTNSMEWFISHRRYIPK